jgi:ABC-type phosphate transport system substrate-binding protein
MRLRLIATTAAAIAALAGLGACGLIEGNAEAPAEEAAETTAETTTPTEAESAEVSPAPEEVVGTWEADYDDVGPHGSTLTINEDGTASLLSFASQHGTFEGTVFFGDGDPHRFTGTVAEDGTEIEVGLEYDEDADTLTLTYPEGGAYVHTRA